MSNRACYLEGRKSCWVLSRVLSVLRESYSRQVSPKKGSLWGLVLVRLAVVSVYRVDTARIECCCAFEEYWCCALYSDRWVGCERTACCRYAWQPVER